MYYMVKKGSLFYAKYSRSWKPESCATQYSSLLEATKVFSQYIKKDPTIEIVEVSIIKKSISNDEIQKILAIELKKQESELAAKFNMIADKIKKNTTEVKKNVSPRHKRKN